MSIFNKIMKRMIAMLLVVIMTGIASSAYMLDSEAASDGMFFDWEAKNVLLPGKQVKSLQLIPRYESTGAPVSGASWTSSNTKVASTTQSGTIKVKTGGNAVITAKKGKYYAQYYISAHRFRAKNTSVRIKKNKSKTVKLIIINDKLKSIKVNKTGIVKIRKFNQGKAIKFTAQKKGRARVTFVSSHGITQTITIKVK